MNLRRKPRAEELDDDDPMMPHCDPSVLHRPGTCEYCDHYPAWQQYREYARINYSDETDPNKAPCPSTFFRPAETINKWGGNVPSPTDEAIWEAWRKAKEDPLI